MISEIKKEAGDGPLHIIIVQRLGPLSDGLPLFLSSQAIITRLSGWSYDAIRSAVKPGHTNLVIFSHDREKEAKIDIEEIFKNNPDLRQIKEVYNPPMRDPETIRLSVDRGNSIFIYSVK